MSSSLARRSSLVLWLLSACAGAPPSEPTTPRDEGPARDGCAHEGAPHARACAEHTDARPARGGHAAHGDHAHGPRFDDPSRFVREWNAPDRDAWQKPEEIVRAMRIGAGDVVVDLGAGTGYLVPKLAEAVGPDGVVLAADVEPSMIEYLQQAAAGEGWTSVRTHQMGEDDPRLAPESVDTIVALNVWHHVRDREAFARRLHDALRPGGAFVVVDFLKEKTEGFGPPMAMRLTAEEVAAELEAGGLAAEIVEETMPRHYVVRGTRRPAVEAHAQDTGGKRWSTVLDGCALDLTVEGSRLWLRASAVEGADAGECEVLAEELRGGFATLADAARADLEAGSPLGLVIDFYRDVPSVERWFRYQAGSDEVQALLRGRRTAESNQRLAEHLVSSGSLARYEALFEAMGLALEGASVEKVELRPAKRFARDLPESAGWALPPKAKLALPFLTWVTLRAK